MYHDTLIKIKNAQAAGKKTIKIPYTGMDYAVAETLVKKGFLKMAEKKGKGIKRVIAIMFADKDKQFNEIKFLSKPSRRLYIGYKDLRPVRQGYGLAVISTPKGVMAGDEARKNKVGGELLFQVW